MHLPGPLRAAVGLVASAADEAKHLPDRAIELPMLAVSTALQMSLRAQQRYAMLAARGDALLNGREPGDDPPPWATFDDDLVLGDGAFAPDSGEVREALFAQLDGFADVLPGPDAGPDAEPDAEPDAAPGAAPVEPAAPVAEDNVTPIRVAAARKAARKTAAKKTAPAKKVAAKKTAAKKTAAKRTPAKKTTGSAAGAASSGKRVNKPRHTVPSKFDDVADD